MNKSLSLPKAAKEELRITDEPGQNVFTAKGGSLGEPGNFLGAESAQDQQDKKEG
jgi:hypothetical protein